MPDTKMIKAKTKPDAPMGRIKSLKGLYETLGAFQSVSPTMPVGEAMMFVAVAINEGSSLTELAEITDAKKSTASRYLLNLSEKRRTGQPGYGVVQREVDPDELRRNMYSLTPLGRKLVDNICAHI